MKNIITTIALMVAITSTSQTITIQSATPQICPGENIEVKFKWDYQHFNVNFRFGYPDQSVPFGVQIWNMQSSSFYGLQKQVISGDTLYTIQLASQIWWPWGHGKITTSPSDSTTVEVYCFTGVGIQEHTLELLNPFYYDLMGHRIEKRYNDLIILQVGNMRRKVIILEH